MMQYVHHPQPVWLKILYQANENTEDIVSIKSISNVPIHSRHAPDAVWRRASKATAKRYEDATYDGKSVAGEKSATGCIGWYRFFFMMDNTHRIMFMDNTHHQVSVEFDASG